MNAGVQLPLDPVEVSGLQAPDRGRLYQQLGLDFEQIQAIEDGGRIASVHEYSEREEALEAAGLSE